MKTSQRIGPLADAALRDYLEKEVAPGARLPSEASLAARFGITPSAINRAVHRLLAEGRLRRVGYTLSRPAHQQSAPVMAQPAPASASRGTLVCMMPVTHDFALLERHMGPILAAHGYRIERCSFTDTAIIRRELRRVAKLPDFRGLAFWVPYDHFLFAKELDALRARGLGLVVVGYDNVPYPHVALDLFRASQEALRLLAQTGARAPFLWIGYGPISQARVYLQAWNAAWHLESTYAGSPPGMHHFHAEEVRRYRDELSRLRRQAPKVDAVVCVNPTDGAMLRKAARSLGLRVPRDFQVVVLYDEHETQIQQITAMQVDLVLEARLAFELLLHQVLPGRRPGQPDTVVSLYSRLILRSTTRSPTGVAGGSHDGSVSQPSLEGYIDWPLAEAARLRLLERLRTRAYASAQNRGLGDFVPLPLQRWINRDIRRPRSWLGSRPLLHFEAGRHTIHGVPFLVSRFANTQHPGGIIFASTHARSSARVQVPTRMVIPLGARYRALYWLHACGFVTGDPAPFATYRIVDVEGRVSEIPLVSLGNVRRRESSGTGCAPVPNIQDWWHDYPHHDFPGARYFVVTENGDPMLYERYLYTLEWLNPHPRVPLRELVVESKRTHPTTLGLLAISGLKA